MEAVKIKKIAEDLWCDLADESDGWQTTMNYASFMKAIELALTKPVVECEELELMTKKRRKRGLKID